MVMTVAELIEKLKAFPPGATVLVGEIPNDCHLTDKIFALESYQKDGKEYVEIAG